METTAPKHEQYYDITTQVNGLGDTIVYSDGIPVCRVAPDNLIGFAEPLGYFIYEIVEQVQYGVSHWYPTLSEAMAATQAHATENKLTPPPNRRLGRATSILRMVEDGRLNTTLLGTADGTGIAVWVAQDTARALDTLANSAPSHWCYTHHAAPEVRRVYELHQERTGNKPLPTYILTNCCENRK